MRGVDQKKIDRINELARKVKAGQVLTPEEISERDSLRREYIESVNASLTGQLDNTSVVDEKGHKRPLKKQQ